MKYTKEEIMNLLEKYMKEYERQFKYFRKRTLEENDNKELDMTMVEGALKAIRIITHQIKEYDKKVENETEKIINKYPKKLDVIKYEIH